MRWYVDEASETEVLLVRLPFAHPLCANCGQLFKEQAHRTETRAGRPERWCRECDQQHRYRLESARRMSINRGKNSFGLNLMPAKPSLLQAHLDTVEIDPKRIFGVLVGKRCANPLCKKRGHCMGFVLKEQRNSRKCLPDGSCHTPAWVFGFNRKYCTQSCQKQHLRARKSALS